MKNLFIKLISIFLFSSSLATVISSYLIEKFKINFFNSSLSQRIPSFSYEDSLLKTNDILSFISLILIFVLIFGIYILVIKNKNIKNLFWDITNLLFSGLLYFQVKFVRHSGKEIIFSFLVFQIIYLLSVFKIKKKINFLNGPVFSNSLLSGFFLTLLIRRISASIVVVVGTLISAVLIYQIIKETKWKKYLESPGHLLLFFSIFNNWSLLYILILGILALAIILVIRKYPSWFINKLSLIYSLIFIFFLVYNPIFYFGNLDSVEEGFWLGWVQRLISGQVLYRDVAVYYPPFLIWGLAAFEKIFGVSVYISRLYFLLLKIGGVFAIYLTFRSLIRGKTIIWLLLILVLSLLPTYLRNNVEIRVGVGLLALWFIQRSFRFRRSTLLFWGGIFTGVSFFVSTEVGIAAVLSGLFGIYLAKKNSYYFSFNKFVYYLAGLFSILAIIFGYLFKQGALNSFFQQIIFYAKAFSSGYFNIPIERPELVNILELWRINRYLSSLGFFWEIGSFSLIVTGIYLLYQNKVRGWDIIDNYAFMLVVFNFVLYRVALGRSDYYHLIFVLISSLSLILFLVQSYFVKKKVKLVSYLILGILLAVVFRSQIMEVFFNEQFIKIQSYGSVPQRYETLSSERAKIALDIDAPVEEINSLIDFLKNNTPESEKIFSFPWQPEIYFLTNRLNATSFDTPYSFFTEKYQNQMVKELTEKKPKYIIYNSDMNFSGMSVGSLVIVNEYILNHYQVVQKIGRYKIFAQ